MIGHANRAAADIRPVLWLPVLLGLACGPGGGSPAEAGVEADAGADADADGDTGPEDVADVGPEAEVDAGGDVEADGGSDLEADGGPDVEADGGSDLEVDAEPDADYCGSWSCWTVPPTGQGVCYDDASALPDCPGGAAPPSCGPPALPFCGQDAQYRDAERAFSCRSAGGDVVACSTLPTAGPGEVVEDSLTGLVWQRAFAAGVPWADAGGVCAALRDGGGLAGRADWRVPTIYELATLIDWGRAGPAIDTDAFPGTPTMPGWWSATPDAARSEVAWGVGFHAGELNEGSVAMPAFVRCVAGPSFAGVEGPGRFDVATDPSGDVVFDRATGLSWQADVSTAVRWEGALARCEELVLGGADDWRLPNAAELWSLVRVDLAGVKSSFPGMPAGVFWSSTTSAVDPGAGWVVSFASGHVFAVSKTTTFPVRCLRGGP